MPASSLFESFIKMNCTLLQASTTLTISPATIAKLKKAARKKAGDLWFAAAYEGDGKLKLGRSIGVRPVAKRNEYYLVLRWLLTHEDPPKEMGSTGAFSNVVPDGFGEREVDVEADFRFDKKSTVSLFRPFDLGREQSQILDEVIGFTGVKKDPNGKILYHMNIAVTDETIEHKLFFRQTVRVADDMVMPLVESANRISVLAVKPKEAQ